MNIVVCISQVPDTTTKVTVAPDGKKIFSAGVKFILNPYDEFALEEGLQLRAKYGGSVTAVTVGGDSAKEILRTALAMGVDKAVLIKDDERADSFGVAHNLAEAAREADIAILGRQSIDFDSYGTAAMTAELLNLPSASMVSKLSIDGTKVVAECDIDGGKETIELSLPCVISVQKGLNEPRYPKLPDIMKAKSKPIEERASAGVAPRVRTLSMELPKSSRIGKVLGDSDADIQELVRLLHEEAKAI